MHEISGDVRDAEIRQQRRGTAHERECRFGAVANCRIFHPVVRARMLEEQVSDEELSMWARRCAESRQYPMYGANLAIHTPKQYEQSLRRIHSPLAVRVVPVVEDHAKEEHRRRVDTAA